MQNRSQFKQSGSLSKKKKKKYRYIHKKNTIVSRTLSRFSYESDLINLTTKVFNLPKWSSHCSKIHFFKNKQVRLCCD